MNFHNRLTDFVLLFLLLYSVWSVCGTAYELRQARAMEQELCEKLSLMERENAALAQRLEDGISDEELMQLARQRLGLVLPGEKIFYFTTDREA